MTPLAHLVLDLDGTLSDPALGIGRCLNHALQAFGYPVLKESDVSGFVGPPLDRTFREITGTMSSAHVAELVAKYRERYSQVGYSENVLYPGVPEALSALAGARVPLGVCTSKRVDFAERILVRFGLRSFFRFVDGGDVGIDKRQQLAALLQAGEISASSLMIGDRAVDVEAARANGLRSVGVLWGHGSAEELGAAGADFVVHHPRDMVDLRTLV